MDKKSFDKMYGSLPIWVKEWLINKLLKIFFNINTIIIHDYMNYIISNDTVRNNPFYATIFD